ncbi:hypothetical protein Ato02nite_013120 [Paractinoplanes toevensis]|uniref:Uncharacterized protein n=1 Tax=Paractinoplanes toevensis TaxID=571911 RepID=A0A919T881_9ACTN|nr:hypothetical protein Ato02nite_013120 [Actinoplanes toevensis]
MTTRLSGRPAHPTIRLSGRPALTTRPPDHPAAGPPGWWAVGPSGWWVRRSELLVVLRYSPEAVSDFGRPGVPR